MFTREPNKDKSQPCTALILVKRYVLQLTGRGVMVDGERLEEARMIDAWQADPGRVVRIAQVRHITTDGGVLV
jgi:hypothetical protein